MYDNVFSFLVYFDWKIDYYYRFFKVSKYRNFFQFLFNQKIVQEQFVELFENYQNFVFKYWIFQKYIKCSNFWNFGRIWLVNEHVLTFWALIYYIIWIVYFRLNLSKRKKIHRFYSSKRFCIWTLFSNLTYFVLKIEFLNLNCSFEVKKVKKYTSYKKCCDSNF